MVFSHTFYPMQWKYMLHQGCLKDDHEVLEAIATLPSASIPSMS
jgi:hypothetical protein